MGLPNGVEQGPVVQLKLGPPDLPELYHHQQTGLMSKQIIMNNHKTTTTTTKINDGYSNYNYYNNFKLQPGLMSKQIIAYSNNKEDFKN